MPFVSLPSRPTALPMTRESPVRSITGWDSVQRVRSTLTRLESGDFSDAASLVDAMGRDERISGVMRTRVNGLLALPMMFEPEDEANAKQVAIAADLADSWWDIFPEPALSELMRYAYELGAGLGELVWERGKVWTPRLNVLHPRHLRWDDRDQAYKYQTVDGEVAVTPGDGRWILMTPYGPRRGFMGALVRSLALPWLIRQWAYRDWARQSEVMGLGIRKAIVPFDASPDDKNKYLSEVAELGQESVILTPRDDQGRGFDVELLEAQANNWAGFDHLIKRAETSIAIAVLGQNLTTEVQSGSYAAAVIHDLIRADIRKADAEYIATCLREQALRPWTFWNYGDVPAPWPKWATEPNVEFPEHFLKYGLVTKNEARRRVGMEPMQGGDVLPSAAPEGNPSSMPPASPGSKKDGASRARPFTNSTVTVLRRNGEPKGFVRGQVYADGLSEVGTHSGKQALAGDVAGILEIVQASEDYETCRERLLLAYEAMTPDQLADVMEKAIVLADLCGRWAANGDAEG